jgi:hypothetical protein
LSADLSEEHAPFIFRDDEQAKKTADSMQGLLACRKPQFVPENGEYRRTTRQPYLALSLSLLRCLLHAGYFLGLFFGPEDGGDIFFRNID